MRKLIVSLVLALVLGMAATAPALGDTFFIYDLYGGTWQDANKTASPDDNMMCWAAAASNVLDWGGWVTSQYNTAQTIFQYFVDHWTDQGAYMTWAFSWWLNGTPPPTTAYAYPDVAGGNFFPTQNVNSYMVTASGGNLMSTADSLLHKGDGVTMTIRTASGGAHAITLWGYSFSAPGSYTSVYITDSDDGYYGLREYPLIYQNNAWYLGNYFGGGWYISDLEALGLDPNSLFLSSGSGSTPGDSPVPLSPSWVLFGTGLFSLYAMRRRRPEKGESQDL